MDLKAYDRHIKKLRESQFPQLQGTTYLDHAGTTLYAQSLIDAFSNDLKKNLFGNPHSASPSSDLSTQRVDAVREQVLEYFHADCRHFDVVFVANASAAIKLVLHAFEQHGFHYGYHRDCHTSIVGVRESASSAAYFESDDAVDQWINEGAELAPHNSGFQLFAYPAQSNMTGHRPDLSWSRRIRSRNRKVHVLLDAASYLTTGRLDFSDPKSSPDFTALSFYKIFGYPDLGALIVRKSAANILKKRNYFGGGTVDMIINSSESTTAWHSMKTNDLHEVLEDGTLPFHNIVALGHAIKIHEQLFGGAGMIRKHTANTIKWLYDEMRFMKYGDGKPLIKIYENYESIYGDSQTQGPIIAFNILDQHGRYIGKSQVEQAAIACGIQLRTGGVCNPGGIACMLDLQPWEMRRNFTEGMRCGDDLDVLGGKPTGIVRVSLGPMSCMSDVRSFAAFLVFWFLDGGNKRSERILRGNERCGRFSAIEGLPAGELMLSAPADYEAVKGWEKDWIIVSDDGDILGVEELRAQLLPEHGVLRISSTINGKGCEVSLWDTQYSSEPCRIFIGGDGRRAERCIDERINEWLSVTTGVRCALARYRSKHLETKDQGGGCIKAGCNKSSATQQEHLTHLEEHAREFEVWDEQMAEEQKQVRRTISTHWPLRTPRKMEKINTNEQEFDLPEKISSQGFDHKNGRLRRLLERLKCNLD